jgi:hypothetical protein
MNNPASRIAISPLTLGLLLPVVSLAALRAETPKLPVPATDQSAVAQRGYFYVSGKYAGEPGKEIMQGQTYVEVLAPRDLRPVRRRASSSPASSMRYTENWSAAHGTAFYLRCGPA